MCQLKKDNDVFKGGGAIFRFSFKSEGKEVERKRNKMGGGVNC